jgi:hypothetical protein
MKTLLRIAAAAVAAGACNLAFAGSPSVSISFGFYPPVVAPVYVQPPQVIYQQAPAVVYQQPPVVMAPPQVYAAPPQGYSPPPLPPVYVQPAPVIVAPAPAPTPVVVNRAVPAPVVEGPALIAIKYTPGFSGLFTGFTGAPGFSTARFTHSGGLEARLGRWVALRSDAEFRKDSRSFDVIGAKLWLAGADWKLKPYVSASLSGTVVDERPNALQIGVVGAAGLDIFFGKHFFLEAEVRYRSLPDGCCTNVPQLTAVAGAGVAFF